MISFVIQMSWYIFIKYYGFRSYEFRSNFQIRFLNLTFGQNQCRGAGHINIGDGCWRHGLCWRQFWGVGGWCFTLPPGTDTPKSHQHIYSVPIGDSPTAVYCHHHKLVINITGITKFVDSVSKLNWISFQVYLNSLTTPLFDITNVPFVREHPFLTYLSVSYRNST